MIIGLNARLWLPGKLEGIGRFTSEIAPRLAQIRPQDTFIFYFDRKVDLGIKLPNNVKIQVIGPQARHPILWKIWFEFRLRKSLRKHKVQLFVSPENYIPTSLHIPSIITCHDLNFIHEITNLKPSHRKYISTMFPAFCRQATKIVTVSNFCKMDIQHQLNIPEDKIKVAYNGISPLFNQEKIDLPKTIVELLEDMPFFLHLGAIHPRKNLIRQIRAFMKFKEKVGSDCRFVVVGKRMFDFPELDEFIAEHVMKDIIFLNFQPDEVVVALLQRAVALSYCSLFEGFGLPIVEAMASGCPVITSNTSAMAEIAQNNALVINPNSEVEISEAFELLFLDNALRKAFIDKGLEHSKKFKWDNTAQAFQELIELFC